MLYYLPMSYAVVQLQGKQYKVSKGDKLVIDKLDLKVGETLTTTDVLLVNDDKKVKIGTPLVKGAAVVFKVLNQGKGQKVRVAKYKAKSRYRKVRGHRQHLTELEVSSIKA